MKILVEPNKKDISRYVSNCDALLLGLKNFSVLNTVSFSLEEIKDIVNKYSNLEIFVKIDKNLFDNDLDLVKDILLQLDKLKIAGVFFYDLAILQFKQELSLKLPLVWSQTHMVTNMKTCDYYYEQGVSFALLSKEITLEEIVDISKKSKIKSIVEVVSLPSVGYSRRKLVHNYYEDLGEEEVSPVLSVLEKITNKKYLVKEEDCGTGFYLDEVLNGTGVIKALYEAGVEYILFREEGVSDLLLLIEDSKKYINGGCLDTSFVEKYKKLGDSTGFFFKKTIYRVKK